MEGRKRTRSSKSSENPPEDPLAGAYDGVSDWACNFATAGNLKAAPSSNPVYKFCRPHATNKQFICLFCDCEKDATLYPSTSTVQKHLQYKHPPLFTEFVRMSGLDSTPSQKTGKPERKQLTIGVAFQRFTFSAAHTDQLILDAVIEDKRPLGDFSTPAMKKVLVSLQPTYTGVSRKKLTGMLATRLQEHFTQLQQELTEVTIYTLTTDGCTTRANDRFVTVTVHYLDRNWSMHSRCIGLRAVEGNETGDTLKELMLHILQRAGLQRARLFCTVHDNGANVVRACRLIEDRMYDHCCIAHNIQLCILDAIKGPINGLVRQIRKFVVTIRRSALIYDDLKRAAARVVDGESTKRRVLVLDVKTRWSSLHRMLEVVSLLRQAIRLLVTEYRVRHARYLAEVRQQHIQNQNNVFGYMPTADGDDNADRNGGVNFLLYWPRTRQAMAIDALLTILETLATITQYSEGENYVTLGLSVQAILTGCAYLEQLQLSDDLPRDDRDALNEFRRKLLEGLRTRIVRRLSPVAKMALLLDPRFASTVSQMIAVDEFDEWKRITVRCCEELAALGGQQQAPADEILQWRDGRPVVVQRRRDRVGDELERLIALPPVAISVDPRDWWRTNMHNYPGLSAVAAAVLAVPATSAPSERVFSTGNNVVTNRRTRLTRQNVEALVVLHEERKAAAAVDRQRNLAANGGVHTHDADYLMNILKVTRVVLDGDHPDDHDMEVPDDEEEEQAQGDGEAHEAEEARP